jgi:hypothetical protein
VSFDPFFIICLSLFACPTAMLQPAALAQLLRAQELTFHLPNSEFSPFYCLFATVCRLLFACQTVLLRCYLYGLNCTGADVTPAEEWVQSLSSSVCHCLLVIVCLPLFLAKQAVAVLLYLKTH